jgi:hypothetical protein
VYAFVAAATGWTWEYIGQYLTLPRLFAMHAVWRKYPPLIVAAASLLGVKAEPEVPKSKEDVAAAMAAAAIRLARATTAVPSKLHWITLPNEARNG